MQTENQKIESNVIMSPKKRKYNRLEEMGKGAEGVVYNVVVTEDPDKFFQNKKQIVLKEEKLEQDKINRNNEFFNALIIKQKENKADQIIRVYEYFNNNNTYITIMEKGQLNLKELINKNKDLSYLQKLQYCQQITNAINQLHQLNYCHRDLKPDNFILINGQLKLIDFGQVKLIKNFGQAIQIENQVSNIQVGTVQYCAPEINDKYDQNIDVWSLGCIFYFIFSGSDLFDTQREKKNLIENLQTTLQQKIEENIESQFWQTVIKSTLVQDRYRVKIDKLVENIKIDYPIIDIFINTFSTQQCIEIKKIENEQECQTIQSKLKLQQEFQQKTNDEFCQYVIQIYPIQEIDLQKYQMYEKYECNLKEYLQNVNQLTEIEKLNICLQISQCINFIHKHKIIHKLLRLDDFVKTKSQFKFQKLDFSKVDPSINNPRISLYVVKNEYSSFEIIYKNASPDLSQDLWSLGIMIFEIMTGKYMFNDNFKQKIDKKIIKMEQAFELMESQIQNSLLRFEIKILLKYILVNNSSQRLSTTVIIQFLQNIINQNQIVTLNFGFQKIAAFTLNKKYDIFLQEQIVNGQNQYKAEKGDPFNSERVLKFISKKYSESISILKCNQQNFNQCQKFIQIDGFFEWKQYHIVQLAYNQSNLNLSQYLYQNQQLSIDNKFKLIIQIINCIQTLHNQEFIHGSLKLENFIISNTGVIILADFGNLRKIISQMDYFLDIYALGQIFYKILVFPNYEANFEFDISFEYDSKLFQQIKYLEIDDEFKEILYNMLNPHTQINLAYVLNFVNQIINKRNPQNQFGQFSNIRINIVPSQNQFQQQQNFNFNNPQNQNFTQNRQNINFNNQQNQNFNQLPQNFNNQKNQNFNQFPQNFNQNNQQNQNFNQNQFFKK